MKIILIEFKICRKRGKKLNKYHILWHTEFLLLLSVCRFHWSCSTYNFSENAIAIRCLCNMLRTYTVPYTHIQQKTTWTCIRLSPIFNLAYANTNIYADMTQVCKYWSFFSSLSLNGFQFIFPFRILFSNLLLFHYFLVSSSTAIEHSKERKKNAILHVFVSRFHSCTFMPEWWLVVIQGYKKLLQNICSAFCYVKDKHQIRIEYGNAIYLNFKRTNKYINIYAIQKNSFFFHTPVAFAFACFFCDLSKCACVYTKYLPFLLPLLLFTKCLKIRISNFFSCAPSKTLENLVSGIFIYWWYNCSHAEIGKYLDAWKSHVYTCAPLKHRR